MPQQIAKRLFHFYVIYLKKYYPAPYYSYWCVFLSHTNITMQIPNCVSQFFFGQVSLDLLENEESLEDQANLGLTVLLGSVDRPDLPDLVEHPASQEELVK